MSLSSPVVVLLVIIIRIHSQPILERTLMAIFMDPERPDNLPCALPMISQQSQCLREPNLQTVFDSARKLALRSCQEVFRYEQWDCTSHNKTYFSTLTRESAFLSALYTSALAYTVSQACSRDQLSSCSCAYSTSHSDRTRLLVCPENIQYGVQFTRSILHLGKPDPYRIDVLRHNAALGLKVIKSSQKEKCKCYGVMGSCHLKFCYNVLKPFTEVVKSLKPLYHSAVIWHPPNTVRTKLKRQDLRQMLFTSESPAYCHRSGRPCLHRSHCTKFCCSRRFATHFRPKRWYCRCGWYLLSLQCDACTTTEVTYTCK